MERNRGYTVFEAVNKKRREIFVGVTRAPIFETISEMRFQDSRPVQGWSADERLTVRSLEFGMTLKEARAYAAGYIKSKSQKGWRYRSGTR